MDNNKKQDKPNPKNFSKEKVEEIRSLKEKYVNSLIKKKK